MKVPLMFRFVGLSAGLALLLLVFTSNKTQEVRSAPDARQFWAHRSLSPSLTANEIKDVYFGDLHLHTTRSVDAYYGTNYNTPDNAYRYARGEAISFAGLADSLVTAQLIRPLDFLAITDHAEYLGNWGYYEENAPNLPSGSFTTNPDGSVNPGILNYIKWYFTWYFGYTDRTIYEESAVRSAWQEAIDLADQYYEPGTFTTFPGFEWTSNLPRFLYAGNNHRNVIFASSFSLPEAPLSRLETGDRVELLWDWLQNYRDQTGMDVIAIPHNMNISDGTFFNIPPDASVAELERRQYNEPVLEVVQSKGQSMVHPFLSPNDEFADYNIREVGLLSIASLTDLLGLPPPENLGSVPPSSFRNAYVRTGLQRGLQINKNKGVNPFAVGFVGSSDDHYAYTLFEEIEQDRMNIISSGLAAVWARENTREGIFEALRNKETYATTGTRMKVRFFAGYGLPQNIDFSDTEWIAQAYEGGVPMGGDLGRNSDQAPRFIVYAQKDPMSASLDRIQVIKVWVDPTLEMERQEKIYNVAWAEDDIREPDGQGNLPPLTDTSGNFDWTTYAHDETGAIELMAEWTDPDFDPGQHAAYYVRVLEVINMFHREQERAWTSPIYYDPSRSEVTDTMVTPVIDLQDDGWRIYPNPVSRNGLLHLEIPARYVVESLKLYSMAGAELPLRNVHRTGNEIRIPLGELPAGNYLLMINERSVKQIIVR